jgi:anaerobic selenocysteine-containing dehydrogenase
VSPLYRRPQSARPLRVEGFIATRASDADRGPQIRLRPDDAKHRMLVDGELALIEGPRGQQLAEVRLDDSVPRGGVVVRDIGGISPSEIVYVMKPDLDAPPPAPGRFV